MKSEYMHACTWTLAAPLEAHAAPPSSPGYAANCAVLSSLGDTGCTIFSDQLNHASIIDGCRLAQRNGAALKVSCCTLPHVALHTVLQRCIVSVQATLSLSVLGLYRSFVLARGLHVVAGIYLVYRQWFVGHEVFLAEHVRTTQDGPPQYLCTC